MFDLLVFNLSDSLLNLNFQNTQTNFSANLVNEKIVSVNHKKFDNVQYKFKNSTRTNYSMDSELTKQLLISPVRGSYSQQDFTEQFQQSQEKNYNNIITTFNTQAKNLLINSSDRPIVFEDDEPQAIFLSQTEEELTQENQTDIEDNQETGWQFEFTPYGFVPLQIEGNSIVDGITADVDVDLGELLDVLEFAAAGRFEAWNNNKFGIIFDGYYAALGDEGTRVRETTRFERLPDIELRGDVEFKQGIFDLGIGYRSALNPQNPNRAKDYFDIIGGIRVQYLKQTVDVEIDAGNFNRSRKFGGDSTWVEPFISTRLNFGLSDNVDLNSRFDVSGFAIEGLSLTWKFLGGIDWSVSDSISLNLGYSMFSIDYETGSGRNKQGLDVFQHGPQIGITFMF